MMRNDFTDVTLRGSDLASADLRGAVFIRSTLIGIDLRARELKGAEFTDTSFEGGSLAGADMSLSRFVNCRLTGVNASRANLARSSMRSTTLQGVTLTDGVLVGFQAKDVTLNAISMDRALFIDAELEDVLLASVDGEFVSFRDAVLRRVSQEGPDHETALPFADFRGATLDKVDLQQAQLPDSHFDGASLSDVVFFGSDLRHSTFEDAALKEVVFCDTQLLSAQFAAADDLSVEPGGWPRLTGLDFRGANLSNADFRHVELSGCNLRDAFADGAELAGSIFDDCELTGFTWRDSSPGWVTTKADARDHFYNAFIAAGLALPYVPDDEEFDVVEHDPWHFSSTSWGAVGRELVQSPDAFRNGRLAELGDGFSVAISTHPARTDLWVWAIAIREGERTCVFELVTPPNRADASARTRWAMYVRFLRRVFDEPDRASGSMSIDVFVELSERTGRAGWNLSSDGRPGREHWDGDTRYPADFLRAALRRLDDASGALRV